MKQINYLIYICIFFFSTYNWVFSQMKYNDNLKKSTMTTEEAMEYHLNELKKDPYLKEHFGWKLFFAQHPMYLIVDEDKGEPAVGERIPPWGAKTKEKYVERIRRNLKSLEELPQLKLNYQWSALEVEHLCRNFPDIYERMKKLHNKGSLDFLDGSYSQAHLHVLRSESNWRQFDYGLDIYQQLFNKRIDVYARQETGLHLQLPQLLNNFGYQYATAPAFVATIEILEGPFEFVAQEGNMESISGDDFIISTGLDGSTIPFFLKVGLGWGNMSIARELQQDMYSGSKLFNVFPDLDEVDKEDFDQNFLIFDWVLLKDALDELHDKNPPRASGHVYTNWSYIEGVWADELFRVMRRVEEKIILAEQLNAMVYLVGIDNDQGAVIKEIWKTILKAQHHDISWIEVTDLRRRSINRLLKADKECELLLNKLSELLVNQNEKNLTVFNGLPRKRTKIIEIEKDVALGNKPFQVYDNRSIGTVALPSGGFSDFEKSDKPTASQTVPLSNNLNTKFYSVELTNEGLIKQLTSQSGKKLLKENPKLGGEIRARIDKKWYDNRNAVINYFSGPVCNILKRETNIKDIPLSETYFFYKDQPYIKVELEFEFEGNEIGYMWFDETKLNVYYPTLGNSVHQDIPFGYKQAKQNRPLFPANWVECGGLVYVHRGNVKHWVEDGVIANVLAWGDNQFSNRIHWDWIEYTEYDIRLYGNQKIEYYLIPLDEFDGTKITHLVQDIVSPVHIQEGSGSQSFYSVSDQDLSVTAVYNKDNQVYMRGYKLPGGGNEDLRDWEIFNRPISDIY